MRFAPLGGATFRDLVPAPLRETLPDSLVLRTADGRLLVRSAAVAEGLRLAGGAGPALAAVARVVPVSVADRLYDAVARARRRLIAAPAEACPRVAPALRGRFLP